MGEWIAIEHGPAGIRVSCLCPQSVDTPHPSVNTPQVIPCAAHEIAGHALHWCVVRLHSCPSGQGPQSVWYPHSSVSGPHVAPRATHVGTGPEDASTAASPASTGPNDKLVACKFGSLQAASATRARSVWRESPIMDGPASSPGDRRASTGRATSHLPRQRADMGQERAWPSPRDNSRPLLGQTLAQVFA